MLHNFYNIKSKHIEDTGSIFRISFNGEHSIFAAHFPEQPITPGVCLIQICKELTESMLGQVLFLKTLKNVKFLQLITPTDTPDVTISLSVLKNENEYKVNAVISDTAENIFSKLSLVFQPTNL
jgi:3-hydroxyacyl-[acyl-carrier-protein] dehydratase